MEPENPARWWSAERSVVIGGAELRRGTRLKVSAGDYLYDNIRDFAGTLAISLTWIGVPFVLDGIEYVAVEGRQRLNDGTSRYRTVAIKVSKLRESQDRARIGIGSANNTGSHCSA